MMLGRRSAICTAEQIGLTDLYNAMDEGACADLKQLHRSLDEAVTQCYGWSKAFAQDDSMLVNRLIELNREIVNGTTGIPTLLTASQRTCCRPIGA